MVGPSDRVPNPFDDIIEEDYASRSNIAPPSRDGEELPVTESTDDFLVGTRIAPMQEEPKPAPKREPNPFDDLDVDQPKGALANELSSSGFFDEWQAQQQQEKRVKTAEAGWGMLRSQFTGAMKRIIPDFSLDDTPLAPLNEFARKQGFDGYGDMWSETMLPDVITDTEAGKRLNITEYGRGVARGLMGTAGATAKGVEQYAETAGWDGVKQGAATIGDAMLGTAGSEYLQGKVRSAFDIRKESWIRDTVNFAVGGTGEVLGNIAPIAAAFTAGGPFSGTGLVYTMSVGGMRDELQQQGINDPAVLRNYSYTAGAVIAALDRVFPESIARTLTAPAKQELVKYVVRETGKATLRAAGRGALTEGVTEAVQEVVQIAAVAHAAARAGITDFSPVIDALSKGESFERIVNAGILGAIGGKVIGGISGGAKAYSDATDAANAAKAPPAPRAGKALDDEPEITALEAEHDADRQSAIDLEERIKDSRDAAEVSDLEDELAAVDDRIVAREARIAELSAGKAKTPAVAAVEDMASRVTGQPVELDDEAGAAIAEVERLVAALDDDADPASAPFPLDIAASQSGRRKKSSPADIAKLEQQLASVSTKAKLAAIADQAGIELPDEVVDAGPDAIRQAVMDGVKARSGRAATKPAAGGRLPSGGAVTAGRQGSAPEAPQAAEGRPAGPVTPAQIQNPLLVAALGEEEFRSAYLPMATRNLRALAGRRGLAQTHETAGKTNSQIVDLMWDRANESLRNLSPRHAQAGRAALREQSGRDGTADQAQSEQSDAIAPYRDGIATLIEAEASARSAAKTAPERVVLQSVRNLSAKIDLSRFGEDQAFTADRLLAEVYARVADLGQSPSIQPVIDAANALFIERGIRELAHAGEVAAFDAGAYDLEGSPQSRPGRVTVIEPAIVRTMEGGSAELLRKGRAEPVGQQPRQIVTPGGEMEVSAVPEIVDLNDLKAATGKLQPRDRSRAESGAGIRERAARLDPEQLLASRVSDSGAPIVSRDGTIISGNGRAASIGLAYAEFPDRAEAYRAALGPDAEGMGNPILVMRIVDDLSPAELQRFADMSNRERIASMSATERAVRDARAAGPEVMGLYQGGEFTASPNREFFQAFIASVVTSNERGKFSANGVLTKEGTDRLNAAVLAAAYDDVAALSLMLESTDDNIRSITNAMRDASGAFARLRAGIDAGVVRADMDVTPALTEAARIVADLRRRNVKVENFFAQQDAFNQVQPEVEAFIRLFYNVTLTRARSQKDVSDALTAIAEEAARHEEAGFLVDDTTALDVIEVGRRRVSASADQTSLFGSEADARGTIQDAGRTAPEPEPSDGSGEADQLRSNFYDLIEGKTAKKTWAASLGISDAELDPLIEEALEAGWLRMNGGKVFRVSPAKRPARPDAAVAEEVVARPPALDDQTTKDDAETRARAKSFHATVANRISSVTDPVARDYATRVNDARLAGLTKPFDALVNEMVNDDRVKKAQKTAIANALFGQNFKSPMNYDGAIYNFRPGLRESGDAVAELTPSGQEFHRSIEQLHGVIKEKLRLADIAEAQPVDPAVSAAVAKITNPAARAHADALVNATGDQSAFEAAFSALSADKAIKQPQMVEIAKAVYGGIPKSTSRAKALGFIRKPHDGRISARRGIEATGGRGLAAIGGRFANALPEESYARETAVVDLAVGSTVVVDDEVVELVLDEAAPYARMLPQGWYYGAIELIEPHGGGNRATAYFRKPDGTMHAHSGLASDFIGNRAVTIPADVGGFIGLIRFGEFAGFEETLRGELAHEVAHALRRAGHLPSHAFDQLRRHALALRIMGMRVYDYLKLIGDPLAENLRNDPTTLHAAYKRQYADRADHAEVMAQEHVSHLTELAARGFLTEDQLAPVRDIIDQIIDGRAANGSLSNPEGINELLASVRESGRGIPHSLPKVSTVTVRRKSDAPVAAIGGQKRRFSKEEKEQFAAHRQAELAYNVGASDIPPPDSPPGYDAWLDQGGEKSADQEDLDQKSAIADSKDDGGSILAAIGGSSTPNLDMAQEARMARAEALGFTIEAVHTTNNEFSEFSLDKAGSKTDPGWLGRAMYFSPMSQVRSEAEKSGEGYWYNTNESDGTRNLPVLLRLRNPFKIGTSNKKGHYYTADFTSLHEFGWTYDTIPEDITNRETNKLSKEGVIDVNFSINRKQRAEEHADKFTQAVKDAGYDGIILSHPDQGEIAVFDPSNIRSVHARFDPAEEGSSNLLAAIGGLSNASSRELTDHLDQRYGGRVWPAPKAVEDALLQDEDMRRVIERLNRAGVPVQVVETAGDRPFDAGYDTDRNVAMLARAVISDGSALLRHEEVHALRRLGLLTEAEWSTLVKLSRKLGVRQTDIEGVGVLNEGYRSILLEEAAFNSGLDNRAIRDQSLSQNDYLDRLQAALVEMHGEVFTHAYENTLDEEAVAYMINRRREGDKFAKSAQTIIDRILAFFERFGNAIRGQGFNTIEDIVDGIVADVESGRIAERAGPLTEADFGLEAAKSAAGSFNMLAAITAYHGSPHDFNRFSMDKIGTGEGAQAFGRGLYFAEKETVANDYVARLATGPAMQTSDLTDPDRLLTMHGGDVAKALVYIRKEIADSKARPSFTSNIPSIAEYNRTYVSDLEQALTVIEMGGARKKGVLYTVEIDAGHDDLLDWDKPLNQQTENVKSKIASRFGEEYVKSKVLTGAQMVQGNVDSLRDIGIIGIRYLDQHSRDYGRGTHNYVIFDDSLITITHKDGKPVSEQERLEVVEGMKAGNEPLFAIGGSSTPGLDMSQEARMARAEAMGFTIEAVHTTNNEFSEFSLDRAGSKTDPGWLGRAIYFTPMSQVQKNEQRFGHGHSYGASYRDGARNVAVRLRLRKPFHIGINRADTGEMYIADFASLHAFGWPHNNIPQIVTTNEMKSLPREEIFDAKFTAKRHKRGGEHADQFTRALLAAGYDGVILSDPNNYLSEIAVFDPSNIRSVHARFDPAEEGRSNLLAAIGAPVRTLPEQDALGYYSKALEAARSLKQAKGTPEQMLAQLKSAGVKDAEIETTGLRALLESKASSPEPVAVSNEDAAKEMQRQIGSDLEYNRYGLRVTQEQILVGSQPPNSRIWDDGEPTKDYLDGSSSINFDPTNVDSIENAIRSATSYDGDYVSIIGAQRYEHGQDTDEVILMDARVLASFERETGTFNDRPIRIVKPGKPSIITKEEIVKHLEENRVELMSVVSLTPAGRHNAREQWYRTHPNEDMPLQQSRALDSTPQPKWPHFSFDPSNGTYRETVLHLPDGALNRETPEWKAFAREMRAKYGDEWFAELDDAESARRLEMSRGNEETPDFTYGHFPEPNIVGHMMTSTVLDSEGRDVMLLDQIQSDWGQKLRDGGVRDEAKIAELEGKLAAAQSRSGLSDSALDMLLLYDYDMSRVRALDVDKATDIMRWSDARKGQKRLAREELMTASDEQLNIARTAWALTAAELQTAEASASGHPLVNTTDQWVNTVLRRAIRQAVESGAHSIAIPSGKTVLSYNPGDEAGMEGFYDKIVPKNLRNLLRKLDPKSPDGVRVEKLKTPSDTSEKQKGFTVFEITPEARSRVLSEGQPMFAIGGGIAKALESNDAALMKEFSDLLAAGQPVNIPEGDVSLALEAVEPDLDLVPTGTVVAAISKLVTSDRHPGHVVASFRTPEGRTLTATLPWERVKNSRAVFLPGRRPAILIFHFSKPPLAGKVGLEVDAAVPVEKAAVSLDEVADMRFILRDLVRASFRHELIHALRATGALTGNRWNRLVDHANSLGLLDLDADAPASQRMIQRTLGIVPTRTLHDAYSTIYAGSANLQELMDQESVAALMELSWFGSISDADVAPVRGVLDEIARGELMGGAARPTGQPMFAIGGRVGAAKKPAVKSVYDIIGDLKDAISLTTTQGLTGLRIEDENGRQIANIRPNSRGMVARIKGQFDRLRGVARIARSGDLPTIAHEGAHHLEMRIGEPLAELIDTYRDELEPLAYDTGDVSEGFAHFFTSYIMDPDLAKMETSEDFVTAFEELVDGEESGFLATLHQVQKDYAAYAAADPAAQVAANVATNAPDSLVEKARKAVGSPPRTFDFLGRVVAKSMLDRQHPWRMLVQRLLAVSDKNKNKDSEGRPISIRDWENPHKRAHMLASGYKSGLMTMTWGVPEYGTLEVSGPSLQDALAEAYGGYGKTQWEEAKRKEFDGYLESVQMIEEWKLYEAKIARRARLRAAIEQAVESRSSANDAARRYREQIATRERQMVAERTSASDGQRMLDAAEHRLEVLAERRANADRPEWARKRAAAQHDELGRQAHMLRKEVVKAQDNATEIAAELADRRAKLDAAESGIDRLDGVIESTRAAQKQNEDAGLKRGPANFSRSHYEAAKTTFIANNPTFESAAKKVYEWQHRLLTFEWKAGMWTDEEYARMSKNKDWYVPAMRKMDDIDVGGGSGPRNQGAIAKFEKSKRRIGSSRAIIGATESMMERAFHTGMSVTFNELIGSVRDLLPRIGEGSAAIAELVDQEHAAIVNAETMGKLKEQAIALGMDADEAAIFVRRVQHELTGTDLHLFYGPGKLGPNRPFLLPHYRNGKRDLIRLNDRDLAESVFNAAQALNVETVSLLVQAAGIPARLRSRGTVGHWAFFVPNLVRDASMQTYFFRTIPFVPHIKGFYYELSASAWGKNLHETLGLEAPTYAQQYNMLNGMSGGSLTNDIGTLKDKLAVENLRYRGLHFANWREGLNPFSDNFWMQTISNMSETAGRIGLYETLLTRAITHDPAISEYNLAVQSASRTTDLMDYNRFGDRMRNFNFITTFANPNIRGIARAAREFSGSSDRGTAIGQLIRLWYRHEAGEKLSRQDRDRLADAGKITFMVMLGGFLTLLMHIVQSDDEEYKLIREDTATRDMPFKVNGIWYKMKQWAGFDLKPEERKGDWMRAPKPFEMALPGEVMIAAYDHLVQKDPRFWERVRHSIGELAVPPTTPEFIRAYVGLTTGKQDRTDVLKDIVSGESAQSYDMTGFQEEGLDAWMQYDAYTSAVSMTLARKAHDAGFEISPDTIDFMLGSAGYYGREIEMVSNRVAGREPGKWADEVIVGTLINRLSIDISRSSQSKADLMKLMAYQNGSYIQAANSYGKFFEEPFYERTSGKTPTTYLAELPEEKRAFALISQHFDAKTKAIHPLIRAKNIAGINSSVLTAMAMEQLTDSSIEPVKGERKPIIAVPPSQFESMKKSIGMLTAIEAANGLMAVGEGKWGPMQPIDAKVVLAEIRAINAKVYDEMMRQYKKRHVYADDAAIRKNWPKARELLLKYGQDAVLTGLKY